MASVATNGVNGHLNVLNRIFPEAHLSLKEADPELYAIIEDEKRRQWYVVSN